MRSIGMPVWSLTIMAYAVWWPWPCESVPQYTVAEPSACTCSRPNSVDPPPAVISTYDATPMPSCTVSPRSRRALLLATQLVVPDRLGGGAQRQAVAAAVVDVAGERGEREHGVGEQVALAQLDRVDAELVRRLVDEALEQRRGLGPAGAAVGAHRAGVGGRDHHVELDRREVVRAVRHAARAAGQRRADAGVGAAVADEPDPQTGERAVVAAAELGVLHLAAAVGHGHHVLAAGRHPHHRSSEPSCRRGDDGVLVLDARPCRRSRRRPAG